MPARTGYRRAKAIQLRIEQRMATSEIARLLSVSYPCAKRYVNDYPLTQEEIKHNENEGTRRRWSGYIKKPRDVFKQRQHCKNHYLNNKDYYKRKARKHDQLRKDRFICIVNAAKDVPCCDCKNRFHVIAMDLDHVRGKKVACVSTMVQMHWKFSEEQLKAEIEKCEAVCACCHRVRTWNRMITRKEAVSFNA